MVYLPAILVRQGIGSRQECSEIREYATSPGCSVDVMHGRGSLLRHNIRGDIVYCYPSDDFNGVKNFNGVKKVQVHSLLQIKVPGKRWHVDQTSGKPQRIS
jgi:hypothetical protein